MPSAMNAEAPPALAEVLRPLTRAPCPGSPGGANSPSPECMSDAPQRSSRPSPFEALGAVARTLGESLDIRQVFARVADAAHAALPFDRMRVVLLESHEGHDGFRMHATEQ